MTESNVTGQPAASQQAPQYQKRSRKGLAVALAAVIVAVIAIGATVFAMNRAAGPQADGQLTVGLTLSPTNLDIRETGGVALDQILIDNIYEGLIGLKVGTLDEFTPVLAEDLPDVSADGLTYTFALRDGVVFHSGQALTAADVVDSLSAESGPASLTTALGAPVHVSAPDEQTIVLELEEANSQLFWHLAGRPGLVFETAYSGDLANTANGTGPYTLDEWKQGDSITFAANADYWGTAPTLSTVVWRYIDDANSAVNAALEGDLDVLAPIMDPTLKVRFDGNTDFTLSQTPGTDVFTLAYNSQKAPLNDPRVRAALSMAVDSETIVAAFQGDGVALGGPITQLEPGYEDLTAVHAYDPQGARDLLEEAGVSDLSLTVTVPSHYQRSAIDQVVTQYAAIGVTLEVDAVEFPTWLSYVYSKPEDGSARAYDLSYVNHVEALDFGNYANPNYYFGYDNAEVQRLYAAARATSDTAEADELLREAARLVAEDAPARWLVNYTPSNAVGSHVSGFPAANTNSRIPLAGVTVEANATE